jgi:Fe2+ transport system protein FeoA
MGHIRTIENLKVGESGKIKKIKGKDSLRKRLLDMGATPGTKIEVIKIAPLGDPVGIKVRGYHLSLRKDEASVISVEVNND